MIQNIFFKKIQNPSHATGPSIPPKNMFSGVLEAKMGSCRNGKTLLRKPTNN